MKKILMVILCASIMSPAFAFADSKAGQKGENGASNASKAEQVAHFDKKEVKKVSQKIEIKEIKSLKKENDDNDNKRHYATSTATSTTPVQPVQKINYFLCKTDSGWNIVPLIGEKNKNSNNAMGKYCMKLPYGFAKRFASTTATTTIDVVAPVITGLSASSITTTSAIVSWITNESANGNIYVSTSTPVNLATATMLGSTTYSTTHSFGISGLSPSTTYYYIAKSADIANNVATSSQYSFVTPAVVDTIAPVISGITVSGVSSTTATVSWNTNELATGKVYFGLSTSTSSLPFIYNPTLSLAHSFILTGLTASSTYNFYTESADAVNNIATSTLSSFVTTN